MPWLVINMGSLLFSEEKVGSVDMGKKETAVGEGLAREEQGRGNHDQAGKLINYLINYRKIFNIFIF